MRTRMLKLAIISVFITAVLGGNAVPSASGATTVAESKDFATLVLRDPWDMSEFTDISQGLNNSGQANYLQNVQVQNGIFSAQSTSLGDAQFLPLFAGYETAIKTGKQGALDPISSSTYHCLSVAMKVDSSASDFFQVFWFADDRVNNGTWGYTTYYWINPSIWKLYNIDLSQTTGPGNGGTAWANNQTWQQLRIDPTTQKSISFAVDWVRLTDCSAFNTTVTWPTNASSGNAVWLTSGETGNNILVKTGISGTALSTTLDTQGLPPGEYTVRLGTATTCCVGSAGTTLTVNRAPVASFVRPSPTSGTDYATQAGNPWDFGEASDVSSISNISWSVSNGVLNMTTTSGTASNIADPVIYLNTPQTIANGSTYRYLTYRLYTQPPASPLLPIQNVPEGMISRWIWRVGNCEFVSHDIPFDVSWQTYTIDLSDSFNGSVEETACVAGNYAWSTSQSISGLRFDPNEDILGQPFVQQLDWIKLTQVDSVTRGTAFPLQITLNKAWTGVTLNFYYTTDTRSPRQHTAAIYSTQTSPAGQFRIYVPMVLREWSGGAGSTDPNASSYLWNTASVAPGTYYVCVVAADSLNETTSCSEAPLVVN